MLKSILFTHDDLDGAGCRIIYELAHIGLTKGKDFDVINCSNTFVNKQVLDALEKEDYIGKNTEICFADIVCGKDVLQKLVDSQDVVRVWDHHTGNFPAQQVLPTAIIIPYNGFGTPESGTSLIYKYYADLAFSKTGDAEYCSPAFTSSDRRGIILSTLADTIRSYDTYEWKSTNNMDAKKLQILFFMLGMEVFCKRYIDRITENNIPSENLFNPYDLEFIDAKLQAEQRTIDSITKESIIECNIRGYNAAFLMYPVGANISEVASQFLERYPEYDLFASFTLARGGEFSFRTRREDLDVEEIFATPIGGGGHPKASGAPVQPWIKEGLLNELLENLNGYYPKEEGGN